MDQVLPVGWYAFLDVLPDHHGGFTELVNRVVLAHIRGAVTDELVRDLFFKCVNVMPRAQGGAGGAVLQLGLAAPQPLEEGKTPRGRKPARKSRKRPPVQAARAAAGQTLCLKLVPVEAAQVERVRRLRVGAWSWIRGMIDEGRIAEAVCSALWSMAFPTQGVEESVLTDDVLAYTEISRLQFRDETPGGWRGGEAQDAGEDVRSPLGVDVGMRVLDASFGDGV